MPTTAQQIFDRWWQRKRMLITLRYSLHKIKEMDAINQTKLYEWQRRMMQILDTRTQDAQQE